MKIEIKHYQDVSKDDFYDLAALRISVFVIEQDCPYQELDGLDKDAYHLIVSENEQIIGTLRMLKPGVQYNELAIGRVVSHPDHRNKRMGHFMMEACMKYVKNELGLNSVRLSAQTHLTSFYEKYGFESTGKEYLEDGIPHTEMLFDSSK